MLVTNNYALTIDNILRYVLFANRGWRANATGNRRHGAEALIELGVKEMRKQLSILVRFGFGGLAILLLLGGLSGPVDGQQVYGSINGVITDPNGSVVPDATVTATNEGTNAVTSTKSDAVGAYVISNLQPGTYDVETTVTGFGSYKQTGVHVEVGLSTTAYVHLALAGQQAVIEVTSDAPVVNTEQSVFGTNINETALTNLPLNTRRWSNLAIETPGAVPDGTFGDVAFRGMGYMFDNNTVDGAANTQAFFTEEVGRTRMAYSTSMDSVQEFQVTTSNYSAEYGRAVGGVVNAVTKSGTNTIHGDAHYFLRDSTIGGAYTPFAVAAVLQTNGTYLTQPIKPLDIRDQFGADAGGAIIKDKLFWYFDFDDQRHTFPLVNIPLTPANFFAPVTVTAPASCTGASLIGGSSGAPKIATGMILDCRGFTQAQANAAVAFLDSTTGTSPRAGNQTIFFPKIDWKPSTNNTITGSWNRVRWNSPFGVQTNATAPRATDSNGNDYVKDDRGLANWSYLVNSWASNNLRFIYSRDFEFENTTTPLAGDPLSPLTNLPPMAEIFACGFTSTGSSSSCQWNLGTPYYLNRADYPDEKRFQVADTFTVSKGKHLIKFGVDISHTSDLLNAYATSDQFGEYDYNELADYISDYIVQANKLPNVCTATGGASIPCYDEYLQTFGPLQFTVPTLETGLFIQDDWHILPRLNLNLGLRWDHEGLPSPVLPNAALPATTVFPSDKKDFGPRFGFAWDITGHGTTVVRGGYGVYFGRISNEQIYDSMTQTGNPGAQLAANIFPTSSVGVPIYPNTLATFATNVGTPNVSFFPSDMRLPGAEEFDAVIEHQLWRNTSVSLSYIGSVGRFLPIGIDINLNPSSGTIHYTIGGGGPLNGQVVSEPLFTGTRPNPAFNHIVMYCTCGISHYNAAVLQFNRRMTSGLQFNMSYTYASDTDDVAMGGSGTGGSGGSATSPSLTTNGPVNPFDPQAENGTSNLEVRHRFVGTLVWAPPYFDHSSSAISRGLLSGWVLSLNEVAQSGLPFLETISGNEPSGLGATVGSGGPTGGLTGPRAFFVPKNSNFLPATVNTDVRLGRIIHIHERLQTELSFEAFNLFNHVNYNTATGSAYSTGGTAAAPTLTYNSTSFGNLTAANNGVFYTARQLQLGAKISF